MAEGKICSKCKEFKLFYNFDKQPLNQIKDGYRSSCKECNKPIQRNHYQKNKEKYREAFQNFMTRNPEYLKNYFFKYT